MPAASASPIRNLERARLGQRSAVLGCLPDLPDEQVSRESSLSDDAHLSRRSGRPAKTTGPWQIAWPACVVEDTRRPTVFPTRTVRPRGSACSVAIAPSRPRERSRPVKARDRVVNDPATPLTRRPPRRRLGLDGRWTRSRSGRRDRSRRRRSTASAPCSDPPPSHSERTSATWKSRAPRPRLGPAVGVEFGAESAPFGLPPCRQWFS